MSNWADLLPLVVLAVAAWFLLVRPMRARQRHIAQTQDALGVGSRVILTSGIYGDVASLSDDSVHLTIAPGVTIEVHRQAVGRVVAPRDGEPTTVDPVDPTEGS